MHGCFYQVEISVYAGWNIVSLFTVSQVFHLSLHSLPS